jgi:hypothetical protein
MKAILIKVSTLADVTYLGPDSWLILLALKAFLQGYQLYNDSVTCMEASPEGYEH